MFYLPFTLAELTLLEEDWPSILPEFKHSCLQSLTNIRARLPILVAKIV